MPETREKLSKIRDSISTVLARADLTGAFEAIIKLIIETEKRFLARIDTKLASVRDGANGKDGAPGPKGDKGDRGERGPIGKTFIALRGAQGDPGAPGKDGSPDTPPEVRDKLESLEGDERLDKSAIKGFEDELKKLEVRIDAIPRGGTASRSNNSTRFYDLSAQTNGSKKVFTVPKGLAAIVLGSDFPTVLMEGNGFTLNASRTQLTLTVVNAPSSGSQLLYQYMSQFN